MRLTEKQAFKVGFLLKCAEDGLTLDETRQRVKEAIEHYHGRQKKAALPLALQPFGWAADKAMSLGSKGLSLLPGALSSAGILGIAAPVAAGAGVGYGAAKLTQPDRSIIDEAKQDEVVGEYERLAAEARRRARIKHLQQLTGRRIIALTPGATE